MVKPRILVTGATGKTGSVVVSEMLNAGYPVRALVHREDKRSARLAAQGAGIAVSGLADVDRVERPEVRHVVVVDVRRGNRRVRAGHGAAGREHAGRERGRNAVQFHRCLSVNADTLSAGQGPFLRVHPAPRLFPATPAERIIGAYRFAA